MAVVDIISFIRDALVDPETGQPFQLYPAQERFLREAFTLTADGRLPYSELVFGAPKKSGKTATAAMAAVYTAAVLAPRYGEIIIAANDLEQAQGRVFQAAARICQASPLLRPATKITAQRIEFLHTGTAMLAVANDYAGTAGSNQNAGFVDEPWAMTSESAHRMWDELVPPPTRTIAFRMSTSYAGFLGEGDVLEALYKRGLEGEEIGPSLYRQPGMLMAWHHEPVAPWQTPEWLEQCRRSLRPNAYLRMIENRWVSAESSFVDPSWWDACTAADYRPVLADPSLPVFVGVDASTKHDMTALVACTFDREQKRVRLVTHRAFQPSPDNPLNFEDTIERTLREWHSRFNVRSIRFDPWQLVAVAQRLRSAGLPMREFPQTVSNLTAASSNLYQLIRDRNLLVYPDDALRSAIARAVAAETARGFRLAKEKQAHKIDLAVALAQSALAAVEEGSRTPAGTIKVIGHSYSTADPGAGFLPARGM